MTELCVRLDWVLDLGLWLDDIGRALVDGGLSDVHVAKLHLSEEALLPRPRDDTEVRVGLAPLELDLDVDGLLAVLGPLEADVSDRPRVFGGGCHN